MKARMGVLLVALAVAVAGCSSSSSPGGDTNGTAANVGAPLPANVRSEGKLAVGVKCDYPPFGAIDEGGDHAGFEIDIAHKMAEYAFGNSDAVTLTCVTG